MVSGRVKDITASSSRLSALTDSGIISYKISSGEQLQSFEVDDSYTSIQQMSSKIFAKHGTNVELIQE